MGRKNKHGASRKPQEVDTPAARTSSDPSYSQPPSAGAAPSTFSLCRSDSESELELLAAIGAPAELVREVRADVNLRKKLSQIIRSSEEETAAILKASSMSTAVDARTPLVEKTVEGAKAKDADVPSGTCPSCGKEADTRCTGCRAVYYCGKECQKSHWKEHKDGCRPYTIVKNVDGEKMLVASKDLKSEDFILMEAPLVIGPRQLSEPICLGCFRNVDGRYRCSKCTWPLCSAECEENPNHSAECDVTTKMKIPIKVDNFDGPHHLYETITALRCLVTAKKDPKKWKTSTEKFNSRYLRLMNTPQYVQNQEFVVHQLRETFSLSQYAEVDSSPAAIHTVLGVLQTNHVPVKTAYAEVQGLFPTASLTSHSCIPNTRMFWEESNKLRLSATEEIKKGDAICINYTDMLWGTRSRRDHLQQTRGVSCNCRRCRDPTELATHFSALKCRKCPKAVVLSTNPLDNNAIWKCVNCSYEVDPQEVMQMNLALGGAVAEALVKPKIPELEALQKEWMRRVHSNHYHLHAVKHSLLQLYGRQEEKKETRSQEHWDEVAKKERCCKEFLLVCSRLDPPMAHTIPYVGLTFFEYQKTIVQVAKRNFARALIDESQLRKRMLLAKALLKKAMSIFKKEAEDTPEGRLFDACREEAVSIGSWMLAVGLV